jgi:branched-chain amino acid transport system permease protein
MWNHGGWDCRVRRMNYGEVLADFLGHRSTNFWKMLMIDTTVLLQGIVSGLLMGCTYALIATGFSLVFGVMRIINFAHGEFLMIGMYISYWLYVLCGVDPYLSVIITGPALFMIGILTHKILIARSLKIPQHMQLLLTFGLVILLQNLALLLFSGNFRGIDVEASYMGYSISIGPVRLSVPRVIAPMGSLVLLGGLYAFLNISNLGKAIRAVADSRRGAGIVGINVSKCYLISFGLGCVCAGVSGSFILPLLYVTPDVGFEFTLKSFIIVALGGLGSLIGALTGGLLLGVIESFGTIFMPASLSLATSFVVLLVVVLIRPEGLFRG